MFLAKWRLLFDASRFFLGGPAYTPLAAPEPDSILKGLFPKVVNCAHACDHRIVSPDVPSLIKAQRKVWSDPVPPWVVETSARSIAWAFLSCRLEGRRFCTISWRKG